MSTRNQCQFLAACIGVAFAVQATGEALRPERSKAIDLARARQHWAFRPLSEAAPPSVRDASAARTPIDLFILARLEQKGLTLSAEADRAVLIRRATFDLLGLPPSPDEVRTFVNDQGPDAYERLLDRLLASPHYGERWGRHWLDLARYADSSGFHDDLDRPHAWRYRDYVIRSFNEDKPYGRFVREQIAGDELAPDSAEAWIATGFCRNGPSNENNVAPGFKEEYRLDQLDDVLSTTSAVFLGVTIGCARCHDHKTDPFTQHDYYRMLAIFNTTRKRDMPLSDDGRRLRAARADGAPKDKGKKSGKQKGPAAMALTDKSATPRPTRVLYRGNLKTPGPEVGPGVPEVLAYLEAVAFPAPVAEARTTGRRRALADWIASPRNALTWRVMANRLWQHHFGRGLVATPDNFGPAGEPPSHPHLLDWLARRLIAEGGRLKPVHKLIMSSRVYRQASSHHPRGHDRDPDNTLLWRMSKRRLEAEVIRDTVLSVSGTLNPRMFGAGVKPRLPHEIIEQSQRNKWPAVDHEGPEHWRRSVYVYVKRQLLMPMLELFDAPTSSVTCARRTVSTVPTQALTLLNGRFTNEQASYFARRVMRLAGDDPRRQARQALELAFSRPPETARVEQGAAFLEQQRAMHADRGAGAGEAARLALTDYGVVLMNTSPFLYVD